MGDRGALPGILFLLCTAIPWKRPADRGHPMLGHGRLLGAGEAGGDAIGSNPSDRGRLGTRRHIVVEALS